MKKAMELSGFAALALLCLSVTFVVGYQVGTTAADPHPLLTQVKQLIEQHFIRPLPSPTVLEYGAARGFVGATGDPYTVFVEPQSHELETQSLQGEYGGVGMALSKKETGEIVLSPYADSPAAQAGIVEADVLLAVDATALTPATTLDEVTALVRGPVGSTVTLQVRHPSGEELTAHVVRQNFALPSVTWKLVESQPTIGLISLSRFSDKTPEEVRGAAQALKAQGATSYILDLRNNGGGILEAGIKVAEQFLNGGVVMYETQKNAPEKIYSAPANTEVTTTAPLVVLVNHGTASAAEIVAGALLDRERAPLIGQTTYGKGSVQLVFDLPGGSSLHVTSYLWYTPSHRELDGKGLPPTITVEPAADGSDAELARAIEVLQTSQP
jgi:carboxyl-terminal processing protease